MKEYVRRRVNEAEINLLAGQSLIVLLNTDLGIDRIVVTVKEGKTKVLAQSMGLASEFNLDERRKGPAEEADFVLGNLDDREMLKDYLRGKFWGQFTQGELLRSSRNKKFKKRVDEKIEKVISLFDELASGELNGIKGVPARLRTEKKK